MRENVQGYSVKTYVVEKADRNGEVTGPVLAVKLTHGAAHDVAREHAPCKVTCVLADKTSEPNYSAQPLYRKTCN